MSVGCIDALDVVPDTARANNLTTTFQFAPLAFIATSIANISCIDQKRMRRGLYQATCVYLARFLVRGGSDKSRGDSGGIAG